MSSPNRLAREKSPYLLQHRDNPVDWFPWGEEAFAKARSEEKLIFLSVGYSTCHWCHVMERESFENEEIARQLNDHFVSIKVDREERPDVDRVYMTFVQATTGSGGWPMSVFLTPDLKPIVGGTYYPPRDAHGRLGFGTLLARIDEAWKNDRERLLRQGDEIIEALRGYAGAGHAAAGAPGSDLLAGALAQIPAGFDPEWGGFGSAPKFPRPVIFNFLFRIHAREASDSAAGRRALEMALLTLRKMADGGMHDQLGGGFHRYSVDRCWHVPHFEKMLYDQAQLAVAYTEAFQITGDPRFEEVVRDILGYVGRDLAAPEGGFYSAEDADSLFERGKPERGEGAFYTWTAGEIEGFLGPDSDLFMRRHGVEPEGNSPHGSDPHGELTGRNTLILRHSMPELAALFRMSEKAVRSALAKSRARLLEARSTRPRPHLDDKIITAWNGLMISAFARASALFGEPAWLQAATRAAEFLHSALWDAGNERLLRSYREGPGHAPGFVDDYASLIQGLLDLYEASFEIRWLRWALRLQEIQDDLFFDRENGGYFNVTAGAPDILIRMKEDYDGAEPSPNSLSAFNLLRLGAMTGASFCEDRAARTLRAFAGRLQKMPGALPLMLSALDWQLSMPKQIVIAAKEGAPEAAPFLAEIHRHFLPRKVLLRADGGEGQAWLADRLEFLRGIAPSAGSCAVYVCENFTCHLPVTDPSQLRELLQSSTE